MVVTNDEGQNALRSRFYMGDVTYKRAPVVEAVIEVRFSSALTKGDLEKISRRLKNDFPRVQDELEVGVAISTSGVNVNQSPSGFKLSSVDDLKIVLLRPMGITNSVLAPYSGWKTLRSQTEDVLATARKVINRPPVQRVGVRYINRLDMPSPEVNLREWVNLEIALPPGVGTTLYDFGARAVVPPVNGLTSVLGFQTIPSPLMNHSSMVLDIDVFAEGQLPVSDESLWELLERIRIKKNQIFESCITERMRAQFGGKEASL